MILRLSLLMIASLASFACKPASDGETRVAVIGDEDAFSQVVAGATAQGLVAFDPRGEIRPALAESWHVSDDGRSYIFRLAPGEWPDGTRITARQVARALQRLVRDRPLGDSLGAVDEIVAMTDRVIEIRLVAPRPHLLALLANPALAVRQGEMGSGPFRIDTETARDEIDDALHLRRDMVDRFGDRHGSEWVHLESLQAGEAIAAFVAGETELVLGGDFDSLPLVRDAAIPRGALRFDPVSGLFGLVPLSRRAPFDDPEARLILSRAIDRSALIEALGVPALAPRATLLQDGLDLARAPVQPDFLADPQAARRQAAADWAARFGREEEARIVTVAIPEGAGGELLLARLREDWGALGLRVERGERGEADFALLDRVAPSPSPAWFVRQLSCARVRVCSRDLDTLVEAARTAPLVEQRRAILADAGTRMDQAALFIAIAAPIRWSLVGQSVTGVAENRYAIHPLTRLKSPLSPETAQ